MRAFSKARFGVGTAIAFTAAGGIAWLALSPVQADPPRHATPATHAAAPALPHVRKKPPTATAPKTAASRVTAVTVYPNSALVTREVEVPAGTGSLELVVTPLPPQTIDSSLFSEASHGIRVLTTRYRTRPVREDTREEVRKVEAQLKTLESEGQRLESDLRVCEQDMQLLAKLENFTQVNLQHQTEKGSLNSDSVTTLAKYVMENRNDKAQMMVGLQQKIADNKEQITFVKRQLQELAAGSTRTERDAIIVVDKQNPDPGKVRLNYLVNSASWRPEYKFRAAKERDPIQVEYLAAVMQQTGEDWTNAHLTLSTAEPMLNAAPPDLKMLEVALVPHGSSGPGGGMAGMPGNGMGGMPGMGVTKAPAGVPANQPAPQLEMLEQQARQLRSQAQQSYMANSVAVGGKLTNEAAALEQAKDLLVVREEDVKANKIAKTNSNEGPSVTYHLPTRLTVPSRSDEQIIEVARIEMKPDYFYKAVPVLTPHVYRLANLTNRSEYVLLPGEATMYIGSDFVGRSNLPLVAIGEQFTAGFGVDPQLQVQRQMMDKTRTTQGDNQVLRFQYRILVSSYKTEPVKLQVWDRLPHADTEAVNVTVVKSTPEVSNDALYQRESRPSNLLRWDLTVDQNMNSEKAASINYEFKVELGRQMSIGNLQAR
ncbi:MAG TPA: DUF4139 domain-containing protein [Gemmataceae bacterium]|nr:DUF4139 domain-containing protein [Gemmataceae bacterium]